MGTDHDLRASLAAASVRLNKQLGEIEGWLARLDVGMEHVTGRLADIEARIDDIEEATDHREAA